MSISDFSIESRGPCGSVVVLVRILNSLFFPLICSSSIQSVFSLTIQLFCYLRILFFDINESPTI